MRTAAELNLKSNVLSVETYRAHISTKSYRLLAGGNRELLQDFGGPTATTESSSSLFSLERLDQQGRVIEDVDVDRPLIDQEAYRRLYTYNNLGRLAEIVDHDENNRVVNTWRYTYSVNGKKMSEEGWSPTGLLWTRSEFDEHENLVRVTWFREDGTPEREQNWGYQYSREGNVTEQLLLPPEEPQTTYRSVFIRDDDGRLREQVHYWPDGSLKEKKVFDESGVLREKHWSFGAGDLAISTFDSYGRVLRISAVSPAGFLSSRGTDHVTTFEYDLHGNLIEMNTRASGGILLRRMTNSYRYDEKGNWIERTEVELNQTWQTEPFPASFETICRFTRKLDYFNA
jgi:YD repeat-containing protein